MKFCSSCHSTPCICAKLGLKPCPECKRRATMRGRRACVDCLPVPSFDETVSELHRLIDEANAASGNIDSMRADGARSAMKGLLDFFGVEDDYVPIGFEDATVIETEETGGVAMSNFDGPYIGGKRIADIVKVDKPNFGPIIVGAPGIPHYIPISDFTPIVKCEHCPETGKCDICGLITFFAPIKFAEGTFASFQVGGAPETIDAVEFPRKPGWGQE